MGVLDQARKLPTFVQKVKSIFSNLITVNYVRGTGTLPVSNHVHQRQNNPGLLEQKRKYGVGN